MGIVGEKATDLVSSGADDLVRPLSSGVQVYDTNPDTYPLTEPVKKLEALVQSSGRSFKIFN